MLACMGCKLAWSHMRKSKCAKCQDLLNYGESEDPAKMTDSKMALIERGPSSRQPNARPRT